MSSRYDNIEQIGICMVLRYEWEELDAVRRFSSFLAKPLNILHLYHDLFHPVIFVVNEVRQDFVGPIWPSTSEILLLY